MAGTAAVDANISGTANSVTSNGSIPEPITTQDSPGSQAQIEVITSPPSLRPSLSWNSLRSTVSVSEKTSAQLGWAIAFLSALFTIATLSPTFRSQAATEKALKLAEWTALKDYIEECREELAAGIQSQACSRAIKANLPPPPYVEVADTIKRDRIRGPHGINSSTGDVHTDKYTHDISYPIQWILLLGFLLTACVLFFLSFGSRRSRLIRHSHPHTFKGRGEPVHVAPTYSEAEAATGTVRYPPPSTEAALRRRAIRTHPIYRHSNLDSAIHHGDMVEIRSRLQNGEDVNQHWPYLIYRLAISPKSEETPKRLQVAQLCLDFGADVNALKGWNGQSALMIAIHFGNVDVAKLLIANGTMICYASPDSNYTALHRCVRLAVTGSAIDALEIMNLLFEHGAKANQTNSLGETPLHNLLIDSWISRHDEQCVEKLYPVAIGLLDHGGSIPATIKEKYTIGNPLWDVIVLYTSEWPETVGPDILRQFHIKRSEMDNIRKRSGAVQSRPYFTMDEYCEEKKNLLRGLVL